MHYISLPSHIPHCLHISSQPPPLDWHTARLISKSGFYLSTKFNKSEKVMDSALANKSCRLLALRNTSQFADPRGRFCFHRPLQLFSRGWGNSGRSKSLFYPVPQSTRFKMLSNGRGWPWKKLANPKLTYACECGYDALIYMVCSADSLWKTSDLHTWLSLQDFLTPQISDNWSQQTRLFREFLSGQVDHESFAL